MSAGICGKRVAFEEIFGSSSSSAKRSRRSYFGSPTRTMEFGSGSEDVVSALLQMFPDVDPECVRVSKKYQDCQIFCTLSIPLFNCIPSVKSTLRNHDNKVKDATESLRAILFGIAVERNKSQSFCSARIGNTADIPGQDSVTCSPRSEQEAEGVRDGAITFDNENTMDGSKWVDLFVHEMMNSTDLDNARGHAATILDSFEGSIVAHSRASKERAVSIQQERNLEREDKASEVQHIKLVLNQYQEKVRNLEMSNYTLRLHLQRAQESSYFPGQF
ncbi:hypothetical protein HS088_TW13G00033 [Tripterygium wilfordii]|uniref:CUE domain-containing protein n=1 Tax=Tripterygium wilfordii TaxID=458696 RepID=A0A7J7CSR9_TRIWF|nr:hypothetical protein HS088_TW13G00033 [Tripterygium wilfordii]